MPCRFKYRNVMPNSFGLSIDEVWTREVNSLVLSFANVSIIVAFTVTSIPDSESWWQGAESVVFT
jgi:hypothetical protein